MIHQYKMQNFFFSDSKISFFVLETVLEKISYDITKKQSVYMVYCRHNQTAALRPHAARQRFFRPLQQNLMMFLVKIW
jgi:hypothetical protein